MTQKHFNCCSKLNPSFFKKLKVRACLISNHILFNLTHNLIIPKLNVLVPFKNPFIHIFNLLAGYLIKLEWFCEDEHRDYWYSSQLYGSWFANNYILDTALLLSGGQINQFHRFESF